MKDIFGKPDTVFAFILKQLIIFFSAFECPIMFFFSGVYKNFGVYFLILLQADRVLRLDNF